MALITRSAIVEEAYKWIGTPYHHQGRLRGVGVDCVGLLLGITDALGVSLIDKPEFRVIRRVVGQDFILGSFREQCVEVTNYGPGDVLVMWFNRQNRRPQHIAIVVPDGIVHTYSSVHKVVRQRWTPKWRERVIAAFCLPGVTEWRP